ncbi:MAG: hypothetical protein COB14_03905 [Alphaproteobacteria bacterium]|nr:MAG: hypothetical protein COB14_03905 [Alphaproteobacteria bacterium]
MLILKFRSVRTIFAVAFTVLLMSFSHAHAEVSIAVVDIDKVLVESSAAKSIQRQISAKRKAFLDEVKTAEEKLRADQKKLEQKRGELSKEALLKKVQDFERQRLSARNTIQEKKGKLDAMYVKAMNTLTKSIYEVCTKIAAEDKIDLIITRQNIVVGSMSLDITKAVMERLNKKLPKLSLGKK